MRSCRDPMGPIRCQVPCPRIVLYTHRRESSAQAHRAQAPKNLEHNTAVGSQLFHALSIKLVFCKQHLSKYIHRPEVAGSTRSLSKGICIKLCKATLPLQVRFCSSQVNDTSSLCPAREGESLNSSSSLLNASINV